MEINTKYNIGDKVFYITINNNKDNNLQSFCELSIEIINSIEIDKDGIVKYWIPGSDWAVEEDLLIPYDKNVFDYLDRYLDKNEGE